MSRAAKLPVLLLVLAALGPAPLLAAPFGTRLTSYADLRTSIAVGWNSDLAEDASVVYGVLPDALDRTHPADLSFIMPAPLGYAFTARLEGLEPGTTYYYRVGGAAGQWHPPASQPPFSFRTLAADPCTDLRIVVIGDNRADVNGVGAAPIWGDILGEALGHAPDLLLNTGDMVKNGERADEWAGFVDDSEIGMAYVPTLATKGNHDTDSVYGDLALYNRLFELPRNPSSGTEDYYSLDVGPVHLVSLDTEILEPGSQAVTDMLDWLEADLAATDRPWRIVFFHRAAYSRGNHSTGEDHEGILNRAFIPLLDRYHVDLVFNGHSHDFERYAPSVGVDREFGGGGRRFPVGGGSAVAGLSPLPDGNVGTTYIVTGGAGALTTDVFGYTCLDAACTYCTGFNVNCAKEVFDNDKAGTVRYDGRHNFVVLSIGADVLEAEVWITDAGNSGGAELIDSFTMADGAFDPEICGVVEPPTDGGVPDGGGEVDGGADLDGGAGDASVPPEDAGLAEDGGPADGGEESTQVRPRPGTPGRRTQVGAPEPRTAAAAA